MERLKRWRAAYMQQANFEERTLIPQFRLISNSHRAMKISPSRTSARPRIHVYVSYEYVYMYMYI